MKDSIKLVTAVVACELAGIVGSIFTTPSIPTWYAGLVKPALAPPNWVFAPVWTALFALMGISAWLVWREGLSRRPGFEGINRRGPPALRKRNAAAGRTRELHSQRLFLPSGRPSE